MSTSIETASTDTPDQAALCEMKELVGKWVNLAGRLTAYRDALPNLQITTDSLGSRIFDGRIGEEWLLDDRASFMTQVNAAPVSVSSGVTS